MVVFGTRHAVALKNNGDVVTWGDNVTCQLGRTAGNRSAAPGQVLRNIRNETAAAGCLPGRHGAGEREVRDYDLVLNGRYDSSPTSSSSSASIVRQPLNRHSYRNWCSRLASALTSSNRSTRKSRPSLTRSSNPGPSGSRRVSQVRVSAARR